MDHRVDAFPLKNSIQRFGIQQVVLIESQFFSGDLLYPFQGLFAGVTEIVHYHHLVARFQQLYTCVAADIAGAAGNQNRHLQILPCKFVWL